MLITILKGKKPAAHEVRPGTPRGRAVSSIMDISGPLPARMPSNAEPRTQRENGRGDAPEGTATRRPAPTPLSRLPRDMDPFEADFPWIGWTEPRHESFVRSETRTPTFEQDLERVLAIFAS